VKDIYRFLSIRIILEEVQELIEAIEQGDKIAHTAKEMADAIYTAKSPTYLYGIPTKVGQAVHTAENTLKQNPCQSPTQNINLEIQNQNI